MALLLALDVPAAIDALLVERGHELVPAVPAGRTADAVLLGLSDVAALARIAEGGDRVPVVVLAATRELLVGALAAGAHDGVVLPADPRELGARVEAAVRARGVREALLQANARLARQALTDDLTGLANRRHGAHELERAVASAVRHGHALALVRVDIDHFKEVNDTHGHARGDAVLAEVARRLTQAVRGGDELARWGGDEFVAVLPDTDQEGGARAAERLRAAVAGEPVAGVPVTVSVGWAHWVGDTADDFLARADRALYAAKDAGRNAVRP